MISLRKVRDSLLIYSLPPWKFRVLKVQESGEDYLLDFPLEDNIFEGFKFYDLRVSSWEEIRILEEAFESFPRKKSYKSSFCPSSSRLYEGKDLGMGFEIHAFLTIRVEEKRFQEFLGILRDLPFKLLLGSSRHFILL